MFCNPLTFKKQSAIICNFPKGGTLIAELNGKFTLKHEKQHDTLKSTKAHFLLGNL